MLVLGFNGGLNLVHENRFEQGAGADHDSAAVLLDDGKVIAGIEQERLDRIKHSNKLPVDAIKFCLDTAGVRVADVDAFVYYSLKERMDRGLKLQTIKQNLNPHLQGDQFTRVEDYFEHTISKAIGQPIPADKFRFVRHHVAHLVSAFAHSGFERSLILSIDGVGDSESGRVAVGSGNSIESIKRFGQDVSLGHFYEFAINHIGFKMFDEYKAMGLAPYGDPARYRALFKYFYTLLPNGEYKIHTMDRYKIFDEMELRVKGQPFTQQHMDFAASLQETLEEIAFHILRHYQKATGQTNLCLAGGVAHNCTMNGKIAASGMFENIFVQPAAHDAGCALGAALSVYYEHTEQWRKESGALHKLAASLKPKSQSAPIERTENIGHLDHTNWGTDIGDSTSVGAVLDRWRDFIDFDKVEAVEKHAAELIAAGSVIGWVQGRSEFGPRALGNRSIVADPRPAENKQIINAMVKKREGFRPFAPSVLEEDVHDYFVLKGIDDAPFMIFVVDVQPDKRKLLGAITHVDGSARIQTVSRRTNERYWNLINEFKKITGVPVVLNTSFNNNAEPIVDSVDDAVVCFLTTNLHYLVAGDYIARKKDVPPSTIGALVPSIQRHLSLVESTQFEQQGPNVNHSIASNCDRHAIKSLSDNAFDLLRHADGKTTLADIMANRGLSASDDLFSELWDLWSNRVIILQPGSDL